jgi:hypothetical protein
VPAIRASDSSIQLDPNVVLVQTYGGPTIRGTATVFVTNVPGVRAYGDVPGGTLVTDLYAPSGSLTATCISMPTLPSASSFGPLWIDLGTAFVIDSAVVGVSGHRRVSYPVPSSVPVALPLAFQAAVVVGTGVVVSAPGTAILH